MAQIDFRQRQLDDLDIRLAVIETYLRDREKGYKIKVVFGLIMFLTTLGVGIYFHWIARF
jgi:hypothetical protein